MKYILTLFLFLLMTSTLPAQRKTYRITDYGAIADTFTINTSAIQKAIDDCNKHGGGMVYVPVGTYMIGTIHLKSNVDLYLESGSILKGSPQIRDYDTLTQSGYGLIYYGMLHTRNADNVSISGNGIIDGNNQVFHDFNHAKTLDSVSTQYTRQKNNYRRITSGIGDGPVVPAKNRPHQMVIFSGCTHVQVRNISLLNSPFWTMHFADCDDILVSGIRLWSGMLVPNADGIDVTSCSNVIITDCDIRSGDDAIAIVGYDHHFEIPGFSGKRHLSENIIISNCNLQSYSSGIRIGFLDQNTVRNVHVSHVNITNSTRGIGIFLRDEGSLENISFEDMTIETRLRTGDWWGNGEPIHISAVRGKENVKLGTISNVRFHNIDCIGENGILVYGSKESMIHEVIFDNVSLNLMNSALNDVAGGNIDLRGALYPKEQLFQSDIPGLYAHYVNGLAVKDFKLRWDSTMTQPYFTEGIRVANFKNLTLKNLKVNSAPSTPKKPLVYLSDGSNVITDLESGLSSSQVTDIEKQY